MTLARLDKRVGDLAGRADALAARMEEAAARYREAVASWVAQRYQADVAAAVAGAPAVTEALGREGLARLRAALDGLVAAAPDLVRKRIGPDGAWPHRWERTSPALVEGLYGAKGTGDKRRPAVPAFLQQRLCLVLGASGHLLARHGYESYVRRHWARAYVRSDYFPPEYLARGLEGHEECEGPLADYADLCDEYARLATDLGSAGRDRSARSAEDLWKQA